MDMERKSFSEQTQQGNAMVYILIVVALFAALGFVLSRQGDTGEASGVDKQRVEIFATTIQQNAMQLKQAVDQMVFTGTDIDDLDFITPDDNNFENGSDINKVFHPNGGGVVMPRLPSEAVNEVNNDPIARWYIGRNEDVEWTPTTAHDVMLAAHQLREDVCATINDRLVDDPAIPILNADANDIFFASVFSTSVGNIRFTSVECADCFGRPSLCVRDQQGSPGDTSDDTFTFYSLIEAQ